MIGKFARPVISLLLLFTALLGGAYPLAVTLINQALFPRASEGSLIVADGKTIGSELLGQEFKSDKYFHGRPSAASGAVSGGSNLATTNPSQIKLVKERAEKLGGHDIPVDLVTASASGLDPHISLEAALFQVPRVASARKMQEEDVRALVEKQAGGAFLGVRTVNVLMLNLALDGKK